MKVLNYCLIRAGIAVLLFGTGTQVAWAETKSSDLPLAPIPKTESGDIQEQLLTLITGESPVQPSKRKDAPFLPKYFELRAELNSDGDITGLKYIVHARNANGNPIPNENPQIQEIAFSSISGGGKFTLVTASGVNLSTLTSTKGLPTGFVLKKDDAMPLVVSYPKTFEWKDMFPGIDYDKMDVTISYNKTDSTWQLVKTEASGNQENAKVLNPIDFKVLNDKDVDIPSDTDSSPSRSYSVVTYGPEL